jgi:uncharacterized protein (UPF0248 family)
LLLGALFVGFLVWLQIRIEPIQNLDSAALQSGNDPNSSPASAASDLSRELDLLREIGYVDFDPNAPANPGSDGVVIHDPARVSPGYNLYASRNSPHASLMNLDGEIVHTWEFPDSLEGLWDHVVMLDNGELLVIVKFAEVLRLDWDSNLIWRVPLEAHHDIAPTSDGSLYVLSRHLEKHRNLEVQFPILVHLSEDGRLIETWRGIDHLEELQGWLDSSFFLDTLLTELEESGKTQEYLEDHQNRYDYFHTNTITILPPTPLGHRDPRFRAGNIMLCFRNVNQVLILDAQSKRVVWTWGARRLEHPHHPTLLDNGHILIFDNGTQRRYSRVVEIEPVSGKIVWQYTADPPQEFFTEQKGSSQRLPNGNTLICQGDYGRVFEVTPDGEIVWEWKNPSIVWDRTDPLNPHGFRAALYRMMRLEPDVVDPLLQRGTESPSQ